MGSRGREEWSRLVFWRKKMKENSWGKNRMGGRASGECYWEKRKKIWDLKCVRRNVRGACGDVGYGYGRREKE